MQLPSMLCGWMIGLLPAQIVHGGHFICCVVRFDAVEVRDWHKMFRIAVSAKPYFFEGRARACTVSESIKRTKRSKRLLTARRDYPL